MEPAINPQHRLYEQNTDLLKCTFLLTHSDSSLTLVSLFRRTMLVSLFRRTMFFCHSRLKFWRGRFAFAYKAVKYEMNISKNIIFS